MGAKGRVKPAFGNPPERCLVRLQIFPKNGSWVSATAELLRREASVAAQSAITGRWRRTRPQEGAATSREQDLQAVAIQMWAVHKMDAGLSKIFQTRQLFQLGRILCDGGSPHACRTDRAPLLPHLSIRCHDGQGMDSYRRGNKKVQLADELSYRYRYCGSSFARSRGNREQVKILQFVQQQRMYLSAGRLKLRRADNKKARAGFFTGAATAVHRKWHVTG